MGTAGVPGCGWPYPGVAAAVGSALEVGEHREHAAVAVLDGRQPELAEDARDVLLDRPLGDDELTRDRGVRAALGHVPEHLALTRREAVQRVVRAAAAQQRRDDLRIERR